MEEVRFAGGGEVERLGFVRRVKVKVFYLVYLRLGWMDRCDVVLTLCRPPAHLVALLWLPLNFENHRILHVLSFGYDNCHHV